MDIARSDLCWKRATAYPAGRTARALVSILARASARHGEADETSRLTRQRIIASPPVTGCKIARWMRNLSAARENLISSSDRARTRNFDLEQSAYSADRSALAGIPTFIPGPPSLLDTSVTRYLEPGWSCLRDQFLRISAPTPVLRARN